MPRPEPPLPVVHLNGTGRKTLLREYYTALMATKTAYEALCDTTCHGRDYYPLGDTAYSEAREARTAHLRNLEALVHYLEKHVAYLNSEAI
jgi:hypothetical protein